MKNRIKGIIIIREHTADAPKVHKINSFVMFLFQAFIFVLVVTILAVVFGWSFFFHRLTTYDDIKTQNDSLTRYSQQMDSLKVNVVKINRYLEYFKMISSFDINNNEVIFSTTDNNLSKEVKAVAPLETLNLQENFRKIPKILPVTGIISRGFDASIPHLAIDFVALQGSPIRATADGEIVRASFDENLGNVVVIKHSYGYETLYAHCQQILVKQGQNVVQGETIALVGNSGKTSKGVHLHYEIIKDGKSIDPETLFL